MIFDLESLEIAPRADFGNSSGWGHGQGKGPWVMADLENGLWAGAEKNAPAPSINFTWVTAMVLPTPFWSHFSNKKG
jgi:hypothetical protein